MNGTHPNGILTLKASGAIAKGDPVIIPAAGKAKTLGFADPGEETRVGAALDAAADGDLVPVALFGAYPGTMLVKASCTGAGEEVGGSGGFVGRSLGPADENGLVEIVHAVPAPAASEG